MSKKRNIFLLFAFFCGYLLLPAQQPGVNADFLKRKITGLLAGSFIGDALGGPIEFQGHPEIQATPHPPKLWKKGERMTKEEIVKAGERIYLREYKHLRPVPEPYGHWTKYAAPGTVTDDSRHKMILMHCLRTALERKGFPVSEKDLAKAYLSWATSKTIVTHPGYDTLVLQWLDESFKAINWLLGQRQRGKAYPPERLWNALPTCYGQMVLPPLAAVYPGQPDRAYLAAYHLAYFDNGFAKDMSGAIVAGLSKALVLNPEKMSNRELWTQVIHTMRLTDPYEYARVPWSERAVHRWFNLADTFVSRADGSPAVLFEQLENEFLYTTKWEAQVPFTVIFSCLELCDYDPLAALQLSIEWGWDHDSYAQLLGAFIGALYGPDIFKQEWKDQVSGRLLIDYDTDINEWVNTLFRIQQIAAHKQIVKSN